ncbi:MAG: DUF1345 domain-containing protein, partial [Actinomycetes bacterium]
MLIGIAVGVTTAVLCGFLLAWQLAALIAMIAGTMVFLLWTWTKIWRMGGGDTKDRAAGESGTNEVMDALVVVAAVAALLVVGLVIFRAGKTGESWDWIALVLGVFCVLLAWLFVHTIFTLRYARLFYSPRMDTVSRSKSKRSRSKAPAARSKGQVTAAGGDQYSRCIDFNQDDGH